MFKVLILVFITVISRLIPHLPNFSPLIAVALFSGVYFKNKFSFIIPLSIYVVSDLILGISDMAIFCWGSIVIIHFLGVLLRKRLSFGNTFLFSLLSSSLFFLITNFGVWLVGWYPPTLEGFLQCYLMALPFFRISLLSTLFYVGILFGGYQYFLKLKDKTIFSLQE